MNVSACIECCPDYNRYLEQEKEQERTNAPMPIIGLYIAAASLVCSLAMAADTILGFRQKKRWIPCKYFTINAASLTLIAVAVKLPLDLSTPMPGCSDQLAKLSSTVFMCTAMANFMPFVGLMNDRDLLANMAAMGILVVTLCVNVIIQITTGLINNLVLSTYIQTICFLILLFVILSFSAIAVPTTKKHLEFKYNELYKRASTIGLDEHEMFMVDKLKERLRIYWVMAESGDPQFVMARSVTCFSSAGLCITSAILLAIAEISCYASEDPKGSQSDYGWSIYLILLIQSIAMVIGSIAPVSRLIVITSMSFTNICRHKFKTESYWTQRLIEWKEMPLDLPIKGQRCRKLVQDTRNQMLNLCIKLQKGTVLLSKFLQMIFALAMIVTYWSCWSCFCCFMRRNESEQEPAMEPDLSSYVLLLEGEDELPKKFLKEICNSCNWMIQVGVKKQPNIFFQLLRNRVNFKGVAEFDDDQIPHLNSEEPPNCWTLPIVTLTSIAIALPKVKNLMVRQLFERVAEGLKYARVIERSLSPKKALLTVSDAAEVVWVEVELYRKWLNKDLRRMAHKAKTCKEVLERLAASAEEIVMSFNSNTIGSHSAADLLNWPAKAIAANSMYRVSRTLLLEYDISINEADDKLFGKISDMVADIFSACLMNLPLVIIRKCYSSAIEERGKRVREAARLLGETEEILRLFQQCELPCLGPDNAPYIDAWRALMKHQSMVPDATNCNVRDSNGPRELRLDIEEES